MARALLASFHLPAQHNHHPAYGSVACTYPLLESSTPDIPYTTDNLIILSPRTLITLNYSSHATHKTEYENTKLNNDLSISPYQAPHIPAQPPQ
jgi:hypothetical protein